MDYVVGVDIGAGTGAKIGVFNFEGELLAEGLLPVVEYGDDAGDFADRIAGSVRETLIRAPGRGCAGVGVACPGLFSADGLAMVVANLHFLTGTRPAELLAERLDAPAWLINDAAAGGMAEWRLARRELAYWVLGGGWGGTWMDADGSQRIPSMGWSGRLEDLNCVNEPGFVISLTRAELEPILAANGLTWSGLTAALPPGTVNFGAGRKNGGQWVRAEAVTASGLALRRLFTACCKSARGNTRILRESDGAGDDYDDNLFRLAENGFEPAVRTAEIFIAAWAAAVEKYYSLAAPHGLDPSVPVHLAGGLSHMCDWFLPALSEKLRGRGLAPVFRASECHDSGKNANLLGAASLAIRSLNRAAGA